jgi:hypothetical protein
VGSLIYVPKGTLHAYKNVGDGIGRLLVSQTPGGLHERFFEEIGDLVTDEVVPAMEMSDVKGLAIVAAKYGIEVVPTIPWNRKSAKSTDTDRARTKKGERRSSNAKQQGSRGCV